MAFDDWNSYTDLLDKLADAESNWSGATDFAGFDEKVRDGSSALVPGTGGYDELVTRLVDSSDYSDLDALFRHLRIVILAAAADLDAICATAASSPA